MKNQDGHMPAFWRNEEQEIRLKELEYVGWICGMNELNKFEEGIRALAYSEETQKLLMSSQYVETFLVLIWNETIRQVKYKVTEWINVLCRVMPRYQIHFINHAYYFFLRKYPAYLVDIIEMMADYEYYAETNLFTYGEPRMYDEFGGNVNILEDMEGLFGIFLHTKQFKDIVWLFENRFNVDEEEIEHVLLNVFYNYLDFSEMNPISGKITSSLEECIPGYFQISNGYKIIKNFVACNYNKG